MNRKLIFLDIDGTLTTPGSNVPPESALEAIRSAQRAGHKVFLCSGRNYDMLKPGSIGRGAHPSYAVLRIVDGACTAELIG